MKKTIVIHSGGMDSSICLALAIKEFGANQVLSLSFSYQQRHSTELQQAAKICSTWGVDHLIVSINFLHHLTKNALIDPSMKIVHEKDQPPNTLVEGRNGLMARLGAIHASYIGANSIYMGVIEVDGSQSGYRDCSRKFMDLKQEILRLDLGKPDFEIRTPLVKMSKLETLYLADQLGILEFLREETISCYEGIRHKGCEKCPSCLLRNKAFQDFYDKLTCDQF